MVTMVGGQSMLSYLVLSSTVMLRIGATQTQKQNKNIKTESENEEEEGEAADGPKVRHKAKEQHNWRRDRMMIEHSLSQAKRCWEKKEGGREEQRNAIRKQKFRTGCSCTR